jgi:hypothetical protein
MPIPSKYCRGRIRPAAAVLAALPAFALSSLAATLPPAPSQMIFTEEVASPSYAGTLGNSTAGDCTIAGALRLQQSWTARTRPSALQFSDQQALADYSALSGYNPATGANDTGLVETDVLDYWTKTGFEGNKLAGYATLDPRNIDHAKQSIATFGGVYLGLNLPASAEEQTDAGQPWTVPWLIPRILGGHCVVGLEYDEYYIYVGTWAKRQPVAWDFYLRFFDAAYAPVDALWIEASGLSPSGLGLAALTADLPAVAN